MFSRHTYLVVGLFASTALPYASSAPELRDKVASWLPSKTTPAADQNSPYKFASSSSGERSTTPADFASTSTGAHSVISNASASTMPNAAASGMATHSPHSTRVISSGTPTTTSKTLNPDSLRPIEFGQVFRLDINSAWLMKNWPRVTTGLADLKLHGYRVPLVTGTRDDDLTGALTYYYDEQQVIQKMTFRGLTGDPRRLVMFCTTQYQFEREIVTDPALQVYSVQSTGRKPSTLGIRPAKVIRADAPRERFEVDLVLYR